MPFFVSFADFLNRERCGMIRRVFVWVVLTGYVLPGFSQNSDLLDSLRTQLKQATGRQKFELLSAIGFEYRYSYPDSTFFYCTQAYELGSQMSLPKDLSKPLSFMGLASANKGDYQTSFDYHQRAVEVAQRQSDSTQLAFGYNNLGRLFFDQGDLIRAYDNFIRAEDIFLNVQEPSGLAYVYRSLANLYRMQKDFAKSIAISNKAYQLRKQLGDPRMITSSLLELGSLQKDAGDRTAAMISFRRADSVAARVNDPITRAELSLALAELLLEEKNIAEALDRASDVVVLMRNRINYKVLLNALLIQARCQVVLGKPDLAIPILLRVLRQAEEAKAVTYQRDATRLISDIYRKRGESAKADEYESRFRILSEMLQNSDLSRQIDRLEFQLEIEKKEKENELLKSESARSAALISTQRTQNLALAISLGFLLIIAVISMRHSRRRRLINHKLALQNAHIVTQKEEIRRQNENLSRNNALLSELNQEKNTLMNIVAHDLKAPLNRIFGLTNLMEMEGGLSDNQKKYVQLIKDSTRGGLALITDLLDVNELEEIKNKPQQNPVDVAALLADRVNSFKQAAEQKQITLTLDVHLQQPVLSDANYIGRILDNLISNAIKFSKPATAVMVAASREGAALRLVVKDQGPGFSETDRRFMFQKFKKLTARPTGGETSNGLGLAIVKTLVERLQGQINLFSEPGQGAVFEVLLPVE